jgi:sterol desaturase/sphingolipid hydroxylase (fatty acid hydroxylase superfamily)
MINYNNMSNYNNLNLPDLVVWATPLFAILVILEMLASKKIEKIHYEARDTFASLAMGFGNQIINLGLHSIVVATIIFFYQHRLFEIGIGIWVFVACFFLEDLTYYWVHRIGHERRFFWASHIVHHSSQYYNLSTALRQTWTGNLALGFLFWAPLALLGIHPSIIFFFQGLSLVYQFWIHTETVDKMPKWFESFFNTPSHHRVHHATNPQYLDRNYAGILIIWDKIFGTFALEIEKPKYGIISNISSFNPFIIAFHEWVGIFKDVKSADNFGDKLKFIFNPPGWSPDNSRKTSKMIKAQFEEKTKRK